MSAAEAAAKPALAMGAGPLFGATATGAVQRADSGTMRWLHLVTMNRWTGAATGDVGRTAPRPDGAPCPDLAASRIRQAPA